MSIDRKIKQLMKLQELWKIEAEMLRYQSLVEEGLIQIRAKIAKANQQVKKKQKP